MKEKLKDIEGRWEVSKELLKRENIRNEGGRIWIAGGWEFSEFEGRRTLRLKKHGKSQEI